MGTSIGSLKPKAKKVIQGKRKIEKIKNLISMKQTTQNKLKRIFAVGIMLFTLILRTSFGFVVLAEDIPVEQSQTQSTEITPAPEQETPVTPAPGTPTPAAPTPAVTAPEAPTAPSAPFTPSTPATNTNTNPVANAVIPQEQQALHEQKLKEQEERRKNKNTEQSASVASSTTPSAVIGVQSNGNVGDTTVASGNATNSSNTTNIANSNMVTSPLGSEAGAVVVNSGNGSGSTNSGSIVGVNGSDTNQTNNANVGNNVIQTTKTGYNSASENVGNSDVTSGDANTSGTIYNFLNTNIDGVMIAEFNVNDNQTGDLVLDFAKNCIVGCQGGSLLAANNGNGSNTNNDASIDQLNSDNTFQQNDANLENTMYLASKSGNNDARKNTGGDTTITTGDANVSANVLNFANNNIDGNVIYAVVNVYGNLVGDIVMPDPNTISGSDASAVNSGNGADSTNSTNLNQTNTSDINQFNNADIENNLNYDANTGANNVDKSTGGDVTVDSGNTSLIAQTVNVANMNLIGGNYWLVLVNEAGKWIGNIVGGEEGSNIAGSDTLEFVVGDDGQIAVVNTENGAGSSNTANTAQENNSTVTQTNDAKIVNNVNLVADTGRNDASKNTGGDTTVTTGDAKIVANIVNFVNNNIVGSGKLFVTVINVFGSWVGDFVGPGQTKQTKIAQNTGVGGTSTDNNETELTAQPAPVAKLTVASTKKVVSKVLGIGTTVESQGNSDNSVTESQSSSEEVTGEETAQVPYQVKSARAERPVVNINLAWALLGIPFVGFVIARKKILPLKRK